MPPPLVAQWVWSCLGPSTGRRGRSLETRSLSPRPGLEKEGCRSTWSLAAFLGQGRERKYMKRVAPGLAIWAEMPAARVGVWMEG